MSRKSNRRAFTLVELMVVIVIIAFIVALLFPALRSARKKSYAMGCASNLRQLGIACANYSADFDGYFPAVSPNTSYGTAGNKFDGTYQPWPGYFIQAGYVDSRKVYFCKESDAEVDLTVSDKRENPSSNVYTTNDWNGGTYGMNIGISCNIVDQSGGWEFLPGQQHTIYSAEGKVLMADRVPAKIPGVGGTWLTFSNLAFSPEKYQTECAVWGIPTALAQPGNDWYFARVEFRHPGKLANVLFCDYHVSAMRETSLKLPDDSISAHRNYMSDVASTGNVFRWAAFTRQPRENK